MILCLTSVLGLLDENERMNFDTSINKHGKRRLANYDVQQKEEANQPQHSTFLRQTKKRVKTTREKFLPRPPTMLSVNFVPSDDDIICGRGRKAESHPGNRRFKSVIKSNLNRYIEAEGRTEKSREVDNILDQIRAYPGGFVDIEADTGRWYEIGDVLARQKVGQALRFILRNSPTSDSVVSSSASISSTHNDNTSPMNTGGDSIIVTSSGSASLDATLNILNNEETPITSDDDTVVVDPADDEKTTTSEESLDIVIEQLLNENLKPYNRMTVEEDVCDESFMSFVRETFLN